MKRIKTIILSILLIISGFTVNSQVLATKDGYEYTQNDFQKAVKFTEFICNTTLTRTELANLKQGELKDFNENPVFALQNIESINTQMQQLYAITDPAQIGLSRSILIANLYYSIQQSPDSYPFKQIFNTHNIVLAIDPYNGISLTQRDVDSYFDFLTFYAGLMGQNYVYNQQARKDNKQGIIDLFLYGDNQTKLMLAIMTPYNQFMQASYNQLNPAEKQQFAASMTNNYDTYQQDYGQANTNNNNNSNQGGNNTDFSNNDFETNQMYFNTMQDIMTQQHATSLNIIENIGGSDNYWEVVDY